MSSGIRVRVAVLAVCILVAAAVGLWKGWGSATVDPPSPRSVCQLIRPEVFDLLVPGRGPLQAEGEEGSRPGTRSNTCSTESGPTVNGARASLWVALVRLGRHDGQGPQCIKRDGSLSWAINRTNHRVALGDGASYFVSGDRDTGRVIHFTACLGTYLVYVGYEAVGATDASIVESASTVVQEVLSQL
ncbi:MULTISPECIES: hypothetical protein [Micromonospora]|uniref:hypothetical protein n=1 Tax=Micromonospora TaxID=1873 RepID=UPI000D6E891F|nr:MULTISPECIES: hypothetical protein [unclassified Micromonospora]MBM0227037.1 hypothetical protein [Micromonospora sp. ATA51]